MTIETTKLPTIKYERVIEEDEGRKRIDEIVDQFEERLKAVYAETGRIPEEIVIKLKETGPTREQIRLIAFIKLYAAFNSLKEIADETGISYQILRNFIKYKTIPRPQTLEKIEKWTKDYYVGYRLSASFHHLLDQNYVNKAIEQLSEKEWDILEPTIEYYPSCR